MRRPFHSQDLQGKRARGRILMLPDSDWSPAKGTWLPAKFDCVMLDVCFVPVAFYTQDPQWEPLLSATIPQPRPRLNVHGHIPKWILTNELEKRLSQPHLHHRIKALVVQRGCKWNEEQASIWKSNSWFKHWLTDTDISIVSSLPWILVLNETRLISTTRVSRHQLSLRLLNKVERLTKSV